MRKKGLKLTKFEKILYFICAIIMLSSPVLIVLSQANLSKVNLNVEKLKYQVNEIKHNNQGLEMKINELASLDKMDDIAKNSGLVYNNNNIKNIRE